MKRLLLGLTLLLLPSNLRAQPLPPPENHSAEDRSAEPRLLGSQDLVRAPDYPKAALRSRLEGRVWVELSVDAEGRATECSVLRSSGHALLDQTTCSLLRRRVRYSPRLDREGRPAAGKDQRAVDWSIGAGGPQARDIAAPDVLGGMINVVRSDDYPEAAIERGEQGTAIALLQVDEAARLKSCTIETSSGSASLDEVTCRIISSRARFTAARDEADQAIAGELRQRVAWRLEEGPSSLTNSHVEIEYRFDSQGKVASCTIRWRHLPGEHAPSTCPPEATAQQVPQGMVDQVAGGRASVISEQQTIVEPSTIKALAPLARNDRLLGHHRIELTLDATGKVQECRAVDATSDGACKREFAPLRPVMRDGKPAPGTITMVRRDILRFANAADAGPKLLNGSELLKPDDYPGAAILNASQGRTLVRLTVDERGRVTDCKVELSSGSDVLDKRSCLLVPIRARFEPAVDNDGKPVKSQYKLPINWRLPGVQRPTKRVPPKP